MKILTKSLFVIFLSIEACNAHAACGAMMEQDYLTALKNADYEVRNKALIDLHECPNELTKPAIQQAVLNLLDREVDIDIQWYKDDKAGKNPPGLGEGYGEYLIDLQKTLFNMSANPNTMDALLDSLTISGWNIDEQVIKLYGEKILPGLMRQYNNKKIWDRKNLQIIGLMMRLDKTIILSNESRKQLREVLMGGLAFPHYFTQTVAIKAVVSFGFDDDEIIAKIEKLSLKKSLQRPATEALVILRKNHKVIVSSSPILMSTRVVNIPLSKPTTSQ